MNHSLSLLMLLLSFFLSQGGWAQDGVPKSGQETGWKYYYGLVADDEDVEDSRAENVYDMLEELAANKINLNRATRDDMERLVFLSDRQLEDIAEYVDRYGPVRSLAELAMVESVDATRRKLLSYFVYAGEPASGRLLPPTDTLLHRLRSELTAAVKIPLYNREGDTRGPENGYLGPKYKHWLRYKIGYGRRLEVGLTASQDAGEPFFTGRNRWGYDFCSFYAVARGMGRLKTAVAGRYRVKLGLGLVANTDFSFGKAASLGALARTANSLRPHSSRSEANYLQGAAAEVTLLRWLSLTAFFSTRLVDATLNSDSSTVKTLLSTGYHRTESEMTRRRNTRQTVGGLSVGIKEGAFQVALNAVATAFSRRLQPDTSAVFRRFYPQGKSFMNASVTYSYMSPSVQVAGETAIGSSGGVAALHSVGFSPSQSFSINVIHRFYSYRYRAVLSNSFSDGGAVNNEHGLYLGVAWRPVQRLALKAYSDLSRAAWPKYGVSFASWSWDNQLSATLTAGRMVAAARYRLRVRQRDNTARSALVSRTEQRLRLSAAWRGGAWRADTQADMALAACDSTSRGFMVTQGGGVAVGKFTADGNVGYFNTQSYDSRLYVYERGLLYNFSFPMFYGEGIHYALRVRCDVSPRLMLMAKASVTDYFDRSSIGSGLQRIDRSSQTDVEMQLRWKF